MELSHKRFDEVFDLQLGRTPARGVDKYWGGTNTWVSIADMGQSKYISSSKECISDTALAETGIPIVPKNVVIMSFKLSIGKVAITKRELYTNEAIMAFLPKLGTKILNDYLYYYLQGYNWDNSNNVVLGFTLNKKSISSSVISYPSLPEQQRIVDILDREFAKIDALKANAEKSLQAAKDLFQATLKKELEPNEGWKELAIPEVSENLDSKRVPITKSVRENGQYPYYGASGIVDYVADYIFDEPLLLVSEDGANLLARSTPIAFSVEGKVWVNNHSHVLRFDDYKKQKFVEYWFAGNDISSLITGTAQPKFNQKALNSIKIAFPVKEQEMEDILDRLDEMEEKSNILQKNYQNTLTLCDDLKQSLLRKAFNGEL